MLDMLRCFHIFPRALILPMNKIDASRYRDNSHEHQENMPTTLNHQHNVAMKMVLQTPFTKQLPPVNPVDRIMELLNYQSVFPSIIITSTLLKYGKAFKSFMSDSLYVFKVQLTYSRVVHESSNHFHINNNN